MPGLASVGAIDGLPFSDGGFDNSFAIDGRPEQPAGQPLEADIRCIDPGYFQAMGIALTEGRTFREADRTDAPAVAIVSQSMARKYWPKDRAIGKRPTIQFGSG
jgi:putative ABC transport system permease protein